MVNLSAGPLGLANVGNVNGKFLKSWGSKMKSKTSSISSLLDLKNMKNTVAKKTSYADLDVFVVDDIKNNTTPRKMHICTYVLDQFLKTPSFDVLSNNEDLVAFPSFKFAGSKKLLSIGSHALEICVFDPVKSFMLDIRISALSGKTIGDKLIAVKRFFIGLMVVKGHLLF
ncbi:hypothetical protein G9A89_013821 [Geosiphon pyriformis]|nr:hypothetical protein G9A89_013821 [Geosiphon pyriformis]